MGCKDNVLSLRNIFSSSLLLYKIYSDIYTLFCGQWY